MMHPRFQQHGYAFLVNLGFESEAQHAVKGLQHHRGLVATQLAELWYHILSELRDNLVEGGIQKLTHGHRE
jgi:hypothetical protein